MKSIVTKRVGVVEAKTHLSQLLAEVSAGACIEITSRGKPMAVMVSPTVAYADTTAFSTLLQTVREERPGMASRVKIFRPGKLIMAHRRGRISDAIRRNLERELDCFPFVTDAPPDARTRRAICALADAHGLTVYDAAYLELSLRVGGELWTLDRHLSNLRAEYDFIRP